MNRSRVLWLIRWKSAGLGCLLTVLHIPIVAQSHRDPAPQRVFEVASVKVSSGNPASMTLSHGNLTMFSWGLQAIVAWAYDVPFRQLHTPDWDSWPRFDIVAKSPAAVPESQVRRMLQALLAERFKLVVHHEKRELQVMAMSAPKGIPSRVKPSDGEGFVKMEIDAEPSRLDFQHASMSDIAEILSGIGSMTVDRTGISGRFDFYAPYAKVLGSSDASPEPLQREWSAAILAALGLKLQSRKLPLDVIVVDHCEKTPTPN